MKKKKPVTTVIEKLKNKGYTIYTEVDDIINEIDNIEINPLHSEDAVKPEKKKKKKRIKINKFDGLLDKFTGE